MFFQFNSKSTDDGPKKEHKGVTLNTAGEPLYLRSQEEEGIIINEPTLLVSKEVSEEPCSTKELDNTSVLVHGLGWAPFSQVHK